MRIARKLHVTALTTAAVAIAGLLCSPAAPALAAEGAPVPNASFEGGWNTGKLNCWNVDAPGQAKMTVTQNGHSGAWAAYVEGRAAPPAQMELTTDRTSTCQVPVTGGRAYTFGFWARSTAGMKAVVSTFSPAYGWQRWFTGKALEAAPAMRGYAVGLPVLPSGVTQVSVGWAFPGNSTITVDDVNLIERDPGAVPPAPPAGPVADLLRTVFPQAGLVTNEFSFWNPGDTRRAVSPDWEMTSGSLFARGGNGYTGPIDSNIPDLLSRSGTDSAIFRLNTRSFDFRDVRVSMNLNITRLTSTPRTPAQDMDGVHLFLHYQSQYQLYYASVARRDGHVVIKKKCPGGPSNGGSYYELGAGEVKNMAFPLSTWRSVGASVKTNADNTVTIVLYRDGKAITTATDNGVGCAPITRAGATGIRGDNAEFDFNGFAVAPLA